MTGPPFAPHPTGADAIRAHAEGLAIYAGGSHRLAGEVRHAFAAAQSGVGGVLVGPMLHAPRRFYDTSDQLHLAAMYAAGCVTLFADAVGDFDAGVARLNTEWNAACGSDFGVTPVSPDAARTPHGTDPAKLEELESGWAAAIDTARHELAATLRRRHHRLQAHLDEAAHDVAMRLRRGPTHHGVRALVQDGAFQQLFDALEDRLLRLMPDPPPTAIETLQNSGTPYICDDMGCRPTYTLPGDDPSDDDFGNFGDLVAGTIGGITETVDLLIPNELPAALPPNPGGHVIDLPDQPLTDSYEQLVRKAGGNPDSDLYTAGTWLSLPTTAGGAKLTEKIADRLLIRYTRREATEETVNAAGPATKLAPGGAAGIDAARVGAERVERVVALFGDEVVETGRKIKTPYGSTDLDVILRDNTFIEVGGHMKGKDLSGFGQQLKRYRWVADQAGGRALFLYDSGTPKEAIDMAIKWFGKGGARPIP